MKYLIIGGVTLITTVLASKLFMAVNLVNDPYKASTTSKKTETAHSNEALGKTIYMVHCTSCHGKDGEGNDGKAQDHTRRFVEKSVLHVIKHGSHNFTSTYPAGMPAGLLVGDEAKEVAHYVVNGFRGEKPKAWAVCASCHDENGEGILHVSPNIKTYSDALVTTVLTDGKQGAIGVMPSFKERLTLAQMQVLAGYIRSLQTDEPQKD